MIVDLVKTTTSDGVRLDGALHLPPHGVDPEGGIDAAIFLHGVSGNFYGSTLFEKITPSFLGLGIAVLWGNTRGHDGFNTAITTHQKRRQGAAYETVDECRFDIAAWSNFLFKQGYSRQALCGHSLGAIKAIYNQAHKPLDDVKLIVAMSPPRLSFSAFNNAERSAEFFETTVTATRHVKDGHPNTLMDVKFPFPLLITAGGYLEKYGKEERYNILHFADKVTCPILFTYGQRELECSGVSFAGVPEALSKLPRAKGSFKIVTIRDADHSYFGQYEPLSEEIVNWLRQQPAG